MPTRFRTVDVVRSFLADVRSRFVWAALICVVCASCALGVIASTTGDVGAISTDHLASIERGSNVLVATRTDRQPFPGQVCDGLSSVTGVKYAGGLVSTDDVTMDNSPSLPVQVLTATPGYAGVLWPSLPYQVARADSVFAGSAVSERLGIRAGGFASFAKAGTRETVRVDAVGAPSSRRATSDDVLLRVVPVTNAVTECLIESHPGFADGVRAATDSQLGSDFLSFALFDDDSEGSTPQQRLDNRLSIFTPAAAFALIALLLTAFWFIRRADFALYRVLGARRRQLAAAFALEWLLLVILPGSVAATLGLFAFSLQGHVDVLAAAGNDLARCAVLTATVPVLGWFVASLTNPLRAIREN